MDKEEFEDFLSDTIDDSMDMDWNSRMGARQIIYELERMGKLEEVLKVLTPTRQGG
jgi:hypothetical protein